MVKQRGTFPMLLIMFYDLMKDLQNIVILAYKNVKNWLMNKIKVKCLQFDQNVSDIFLTCPSQIVSDIGQ